MVEAGRVELPSENLFIQLSPSAAGYLKFPPETASRQAGSGGIPEYVKGAGTLPQDVDR